MDGFEGLELDNPTGEEDIILLENALRSTCLWRKQYIKLPNWTPQQTQLPPARQGTPPPPPPPPAHQGTMPPPTRQQRRKRVAAAAPAASSTIGGKKYKFGPSLKPLKKLPYERTDKESAEISEDEVKAHFTRKPPPPKETVDPVKAKRTLDALK